MAKQLADILGLAGPALTILDIGALATTDQRYAPLVEAGARVVGVEANRAAHCELERLYPGRRFLPFALGDGSERILHLCRYPGCSSLYEPDHELLGRFMNFPADFEVIGREAMTTVRLDDVPDLPPFDFVKLDVQGAELDVLRHATRSLETVAVVEAEVCFLPLYKGQPLFAEIDVFMRRAGFFLHSLADLAGRCYRPLTVDAAGLRPLGQVLYADAVYVRDLARLIAGGAGRLLSAATILHDVYRSYDLCAWLLQHVDEKAGSRHLATYLDYLTAARPPPPRLLNVLDTTDSILPPVAG